jgi:GNAT superfamily N-acetyltransferase
MIDSHSAPTSTTSRSNEFLIREAAGVRDAKYLHTLWRHYFGTDAPPGNLPFALGEIAGWNHDEDEDVEALGLVAELNPRDRDGSFPIGGALVEIFDHEVTVERLPEGRFDADTLAGDRNAWMLLGAVDPEWRGHGIGRQLFRQRVRWADRQGAGMILGFGWERESGGSSRPLFEAFDFVPIQRFEDHYAESRTACPDCGIWPGDDESCECACTLWARGLPLGENGGERR